MKSKKVNRILTPFWTQDAVDSSVIGLKQTPETEKLRWFLLLVRCGSVAVEALLNFFFAEELLFAIYTDVFGAFTLKLLGFYAVIFQM